MKDNTIKAILKIKEKDRNLRDVSLNGVECKGLMNDMHTACVMCDGIEEYQNTGSGGTLNIKQEEAAHVILDVKLLRDALNMGDDQVTITINDGVHADGSRSAGLAILRFKSNKMDDAIVLIAPKNECD